MSESNKSYRIQTKVGRDNTEKYVSVDISQDFNTFEILSMEVNATNFYKLQTSDYGCIAGRVLANGGVGIPNAKISIFIPADEETTNDVILSELYPFTTTFSKDSDGVRYNLFPNTEVKLCHTKIGTFPEKRLALDDSNVAKVFEKYYKYTTRTNSAGDYMIFGVPVGEQIVHTDIDLSDIGVLSQKPIDMTYKGYNATQFENPKKFKTDTNIDSLAQVISQNDSVYVYPFWGDDDSGQVKITRNDIDVQYKFEPTCVFIGSLVTDDNSNGINKSCIPSKNMGLMSNLTTAYGTIEMIRKTPSGDIEEFSIQGNQLIDGDGTWCYQIPMNLDYYMTDEYGNLVPSNDSSRGIPTRTRVRFRVSLGNFRTDMSGVQVVKMLVPNNPHSSDEIDYHFGSRTNDDEFGTKSFRDLFWNNVYTVKSYIPRIGKSTDVSTSAFTGFKSVNQHGSNNPIPYNNMQVHANRTFVRQCSQFNSMLRMTQTTNMIASSTGGKCVVVGDGECPELENWYFAPGCKDKKLKTAVASVREVIDAKSADEESKDSSSRNSFCITNQIDYLMQCVQLHLAMENNVIRFNFYNDWINGLLYIPKWFAKVKKKANYLFGAISTPARFDACLENGFKSIRNVMQLCAITYSKSKSNNGMYTTVSSPIGCSKRKQACHQKDGAKVRKIFGKHGGLIHSEQTMSENYVYYAKPAEWNNFDGKASKRCPLFATDIVLLGSLNNFDEVGIPNAFNELLPTTYKMPSGIAETNMNNLGYMYGMANSGKGARCVGLNLLNKPMEPYKQTQQNYALWAKGSENVAEIDQDQGTYIEYPSTLSSGIDWGYHGPDQGDNKLSELYLPGGHFLSMGCLSSNVNIKSCVNLSRICEIGTTVSERHRFVTGVKKNNGKYELQYANIIPSGLINRYDITDGNFRKMFASMNHNRLKTKINKDTAYLEYDLKPLNPSGFNGELETYVSSSTRYNGKVQSDVDPTGNLENSFVSTIETPDSDYYRFRMGITEDDINDDPNNSNSLQNKYLWNKGLDFAMPVYENSFYFYFGLKDGSTALDRFFKDYYADCGTIDNDSSYVMTNVTASLGCTGDSNELGTCEVIINDVDSPYTMMLKRDNPSSSEDFIERFSAFVNPSGETMPYVEVSDNLQTASDQLIHNYNHFKIKGLREGIYNLTIASEGYGNVTVSFKIEEKIPEEIQNINVIPNNFKEGRTNYNESELAERIPTYESGTYTYKDGGYIRIGNVYGNLLAGIMLYTDSKYTIIDRGIPNYGEVWIESILTTQNRFRFNDMAKVNFLADWKKTDGNTETYYIPAWRGNDSYSIIYITLCIDQDTNRYKTYDLNGLPISMDMPLDVYIGESDLTYNNTVSVINEYINNPTGIVPAYNDWCSELLFETNETLNSIFGWELSDIEKRKWLLKQSLYCRSTMYTDVGQNSLNVFADNGTAPYNIYITGKTETWEDKENSGEYYKICTISSSTENLDENALYGFSYPTARIGNVTGTTNDYIPQIVNINTELFAGITKKTHYDNYIGKVIYNGISVPTNFRKGWGRVSPKVPHFKYNVNDAEGSEITIDSLPSIYRPTYINARKVYYKDGGGYHAMASLAVVNPVLYNNQIGSVKIDGNDKTTPFNNQLLANIVGNIDGYWPVQNNQMQGMYTNREFINNHTSGNTDEKIGIYDYIVSFRNLVMSQITDIETYENPTFSVQFEDGKPNGYNGTITPFSTEESISCVFPTKDRPIYDMGVKFYAIDKSESGVEKGNEKETLGLMWNYINSILLNDYTRTAFSITACPNAWNGLFGGKTIHLKDITEQVYNALSAETNQWEEFVECARNANGLSTQDATNYNNVLAIYDKWTMADSTPSGNNAVAKFKYVTPDENIMSIAKLYRPSELYPQ